MIDETGGGAESRNVEERWLLRDIRQNAEKIITTARRADRL